MRPVAMDPTTRARARLWLRSEKALGQEALPLRKSQRTVAPKAQKPMSLPAGPANAEKKSVAPSNPAPKPISGASISLQQAPSASPIDVFVTDGSNSLPPLPREEKI